MYGALPKNEATFNFNLVGETTGIEYKGDFTVKCALSIEEKHTLELSKTRMMADAQNPSSGLMGIATTLSEIRARLIKTPSWWTDLGNGYHVMDENIIFGLYGKCLEAEEAWKNSIKKQAEEIVNKDEDVGKQMAES